MNGLQIEISLFLLSNNNNPSTKRGMILAFIFFLSKTIKSLSQRQWYFGAQGVRIQIILALVILYISLGYTPSIVALVVTIFCYDL